jgi:hypothetical protein
MHRERRLIRSAGAPNGGALTGFAAGDREAGGCQRDPRFFFAAIAQQMRPQLVRHER